MENKKIVLHIPARAGSVRVPKKNIRLMAGKPMISYAIESSIKSRITNNIYVNTNDELIKEYLIKNYPDIKIYHRNEYLSSDKATSDEFNFDIIKKLQPDILVMISPTCPLLEYSTIKNSLENFLEQDVDTLITCSESKMQGFLDNEPININLNEPLQNSQNNRSIKILNWAVTIWNAKIFKDNYLSDGYASLGKNRFLMTIPHIQSFKVSTEEDFLLCEKLIQGRDF